MNTKPEDLHTFPLEATTLYVDKPTENEMNIYLKMKIKSLAAEARIIRCEEQRQYRFATKFQRNHPSIGDNEKNWATGHRGTAQSLKNHRRKEVRKEQRSSLIAYGFLRGIPYLRVENKAKTKPDWKRAAQIVQKFGGDEKRTFEFMENWKPKDE